MFECNDWLFHLLCTFECMDWLDMVCWQMNADGMSFCARSFLQCRKNVVSWMFSFVPCRTVTYKDLWLPWRKYFTTCMEFTLPLWQMCTSIPSNHKVSARHLSGFFYCKLGLVEMRFICTYSCGQDLMMTHLQLTAPVEW